MRLHLRLARTSPCCRRSYLFLACFVYTSLFRFKPTNSLLSAVIQKNFAKTVGKAIHDPVSSNPSEKNSAKTFSWMFHKELFFEDFLFLSLIQKYSKIPVFEGYREMCCFFLASISLGKRQAVVRGKSPWILLECRGWASLLFMTLKTFSKASLYPKVDFSFYGGCFIFACEFVSPAIS